MDANSYQVDTSPVSYQVSITPYHKNIIKSDLYRASYQKWGNTGPKMGETRHIPSGALGGVSHEGSCVVLLVWCCVQQAN